MKNFTLLMMSIFSLTMAYAQQQQLPVTDMQGVVPFQKPVQYTTDGATSRSTGSRLISASFYGGLDNGFFPEDSTDYFYTGNNGGVGDGIIDYTTSHYYTYDTIKDKYDSNTFYTQTFDGNNNIATQTALRWDSAENSYVDSLYTTYYYDANNRDTAYIGQVWDSITGGWQWVNSFKYVMHYNAGGYLTLQEILNWDDLDTAWAPLYLATWTYDSHNNETAQANANWYGYWDTVPAYVGYQNFYIANGEDTLQFSFTYDFTNKVWDTTGRTTFVYDAHDTNDSTSLYQGYNYTTHSFVTGISTVYAYDNNGNNTFVQLQYLSGSVWVNWFRTVYTYNAYNQITSEVESYGDSTAWINGFERFWHYSGGTGINQLTGENGQWAVYPNPASNIVYTNIQLKQSSNLQLRLVNMLGQTVWFTNAGNVSSYQNNISVADLPDGVYLLEMVTGGEAESKEIIVSH